MASLEDSIKNNTAIVLIPGSFCPPDIYNRTSRQLVTEGFGNVVECQLLSAAPKDNQRTPPAKLEDDALYIREVLSAQLSRGKDIVIVMNSYGGLPGTEAIKGLPTRGSLSASSTNGERQGAVVGMIYLSSFLPFQGDTLRSLMGDNLFEPLKSGDPGNYMYLPDGSGPNIFSDFAAEGKDDEVNHWYGRMITHSSDSFDGKVTHDLWADGAFEGKIVYIIGENDLIVTPTFSDGMIEKVSTQVGKDKVKVTRVEKGSHAMHVSRPDVIVNAIKESLAELGQSS